LRLQRRQPRHEPALRFPTELAARENVAISELVLTESYTLLRNPAVRRETKKSTRDSLREAVSPRREVVLLAVTGMSPAILTETIWALAHENPPSLPDRVIVLTTSIGKEQIVRELFTPQPHFNNQCGWDCLREKLQDQGHNLQGKLRFDPASGDLRVLTRWEENSHCHQLLSDIRTQQENAAVADQIQEIVRGLVENPDIYLITSIAGGRKTIGTLLYACMTLIGRESDRVTHVLVNEPYDDPRLMPKFYFPEQPIADLGVIPENKFVQAKDARIVLADLPFVPLRNLFAKEVGRMPGTFTALVARCSTEVRNRAAADVKLLVHRSRPEIAVNGIRIKLSPREQLVVLFLAERAHRRRPAFGIYKEAAESLNQYLQELKDGLASDSTDWRDRITLARNPKGELDVEEIEKEIRKAVSSLRAKLRKAGPDAMAMLRRLPEAGRLSIELLPNQITFAS